MEKVEGKFIVFGYNGKQSNVHPAYEYDVPKGRIRPFKLLFLLLFRKGFNWQLSDTIKYALRHHDSYRGDGASEVVLFSRFAWDIFKEKK